MTDLSKQDIPPDASAYAVGQRVTVTQQVQLKGWTTSVTGVIERLEQRKTGSWYAHAKDDKLWLDRLVLKKDDGEIVVCNLDPYSRIELADGSEAAGGDSVSTEDAPQADGG